MKSKEAKNIRIRVENERDLYTPFSPEHELNEGVKAYIRSKALVVDYDQKMKLTVISSAPMDEEKFRSAVENWIRDEKAIYLQRAKRNSRLQVSMYIIGIVIVVLSWFLKPYIDPLTDAVILIIGTAAVSKGIAHWLEHVAPNKASKWLIGEMEKTNTIVFEYPSQDPALCGESPQAQLSNK